MIVYFIVPQMAMTDNEALQVAVFSLDWMRAVTWLQLILMGRTGGYVIVIFVKDYIYTLPSASHLPSAAGCGPAEAVNETQGNERP